MGQISNVRTFQYKILLYQRRNFHNCEWKSIYRPSSYPWNCAAIMIHISSCAEATLELISVILSAPLFSQLLVIILNWPSIDELIYFSRYFFFNYKKCICAWTWVLISRQKLCNPSVYLELLSLLDKVSNFLLCFLSTDLGILGGLLAGIRSKQGLVKEE